MESSQKERLEQELRFLKESLEADIITKEEYLKGKERIENKLKELEPAIEEEKEEISIKEIKEPQEAIKEPSDEFKEEAEKEGYKEEPIEQPEKELEEKKNDIEEIKTEYVKDVKEEPEAREEEKPKAKPFNYTYMVMILIGILIIALIYSNFFKEEESIEVELPGIICSSDGECRQEGMIGKCIEPGTEDSECEFIEPVKISLIILNDKDCLSCDTARMIDVIEQLFPGVSYEEIDYRENEGMSLLKNLDIEVLPAYIFDANITDTYNFNRTNRIFVENKDKYVIIPSASGASYFLKRTEIKNKLDLFVLPDDDASLKAEENVKEVIDLFKDKINFTKQEVTEKGMLSSELAVTTYPVFLINNQIKLNGVQSAEFIKQKFCELNKLDECTVKLSVDIK